MPPEDVLDGRVPVEDVLTITEGMLQQSQRELARVTAHAARLEREVARLRGENRILTEAAAAQSPLAADQ